MRLAQKIIIIILVLVAPILVFLFLKQFGENEFNLPVYYEEGTPLRECDSTEQVHVVDLESFPIQTPALISFYSASSNELSSDLENVLDKYPTISLVLYSNSIGNVQNATQIDSSSYNQMLNCELVMGEDRFLSKAIAHKYVLVDIDGRIRGYFMGNDLDEIERLDIELDILLNY